MKRALCSVFVFGIIGVVCVQVSSQQLPLKKFLTKDGSRPTGLFAPGLIVGKTVYIAGKGDYRPNEEFPNKVRNCLAEVEKTLKVGGLDLSHVVAAQCYLEDPQNYAKFNEVYGEFFPNRPPARTTLGVPNVPGDSRVEITCVAYTDPSEVKQIGTQPTGRPYSQGILAGSTLYISGKGDQLPDGTHPATFEEQVRQTMRNVESVLKEAGLDFQHVVFSNVFIDKYENYVTVNKVYSEFFKHGNEPARATVFVDWIPGDSHVEITCIATTDLAGRRVVRPAAVKYGPDEQAAAASPAVWAGDTLYISGMTGFDPVGGNLPDGLEKQVRRMAQSDTDILTEAGLKLQDVISGHVYLRDINDYAPFNEIYKEFFTKGPGVRTCLMPNSGIEKNEVRVRASFIAARTRSE
ncbi:MAG TPA: RidA family protein [Acidobacteriota bacterium]|nr:RidA family protein [Acidobacteriota bacterium]